MSEIFDDETWHAVKACIEENGLLRHQKCAFDCFVDSSIPSIIEMFKKRDYVHIKEDGSTSRYIVEIIDSMITSPKVTPNTCLHINCSYNAQLYITVKITPPAGAPKIHQNHHIGDIPIMVMSKLCNLYEHRNDHMKLYQLGEDPMDAGGYFIIGSKSKDGSAHKRVIVPQERAAPNMIFNFINKKPTLSKTAGNKKFEKYSEARCTSHNGTTTTTCTVGFFKNQNNLNVFLPYFDTEIPLGVLFTAYGVKLEDIAKYVFPPGFECDDEEKAVLEYSLEISYEYQNQEACLKYIGARKKQRVVSSDVSPDDEDEIQEPLDEEEEEEAALLQDEAEVSYARKLLSDYLFIHTAISQTPEEVVEGKLLFLGKMARTAIKLHLGKIKPTDRDHMNNKRVMDVNILLSQQLLSAFKRLYVDVEKKAINALKTGTGVDILSSLKSSIITNSLNGALSNNLWARGTANGVSQILESFNACGTLANLRKLTVPEVAANTKSVDPRDLHGSHYQVICPVESPEGDKVGLLKNLAMLAQISFSYDIYALYKLIKNFPDHVSVSFNTKRDINSSLVTINNSIIGYVENGAEFTKYFRNLRRSGEISREISIYNNNNDRTVEILCDCGRMCYPALIVNDGVLAMNLETVKQLSEKKLTWTDLCSTGIVEIIDKNEENECLIANYPSDLIKAQASREDEEVNLSSRVHTHCILHPSAMYGIGGSIVPFPDHNQSPRNCYQASMGKQAIGIPQLNYKSILYGKFHSLEYPQTPLTLSRFGALAGFNELPAGQNAVVCIKCNSYNEEDSIEMSKSAIERGFMVSYLHNTYYTEARDSEVFRIPSATSTSANAHAFRHLDSNGIVKIGSKVEKNDVLICKVITGLDKKEVVHTITYSHMYPAMIDNIMKGETEKGYPFVRVMTIQRREPKVGDKFAARHGQKGTIGMIWNQEDLPQDKYGVSPDIIINSLALPSRMTIAMMIEAITGIAVCSDSLFHSTSPQDLAKALYGEKVDMKTSSSCETDPEFKEMFMSARTKSNNGPIIDATPFRYFDLGVIRRELKRCGIQDLCDEQMIDGITGKPYTALVFRGLIYYQRLKHMACDKIHARARGAKTTLTRQPKEGRGQNGGLRIGWQERDAGNAAGCTHFVKDRMLDNSDAYTTYVCKACGLIAIYNPKTKNKECRTCCSKEISKVVIPYGTHLVFMEFGGMNAFPRLLTE